MGRLAILTLMLLASSAHAETVDVTAVPVTEWKAVYGNVEARNRIPARARISGTVVDLLVSEGDVVTQGETIAVIRDDKLAYQVSAIDAQLEALRAQLARAEAELARGQTLVERGVVTTQRLDQLRTDVEVARNQIAATEAQKSVVVQQQSEGDVLAPLSGRVLTTPVTRGGVVIGGETIATIGGGGFYLRLAIAERHATTLQQGSQIRVTADGEARGGRLVKVYPQIENGRVIADVEVAELDTGFVGARALVELPVGERSALLVPASAVFNRYGLDFVRVGDAESASERAIIIGETSVHDGRPMIEVISGLNPGEKVQAP